MFHQFFSIIVNAGNVCILHMERGVIRVDGWAYCTKLRTLTLETRVDHCVSTEDSISQLNT